MSPPKSSAWNIVQPEESRSRKNLHTDQGHLDDNIGGGGTNILMFLKCKKYEKLIITTILI